MNDLDMIKAFAELDGVFIDMEMEDTPNAYWYSEFLNKEYNPLTDRSLTYKAMLDYKVSIKFGFQFVSRISSKFESIVSTENKELSYAIIECILKSEGMWK